MIEQLHRLNQHHGSAGGVRWVHPAQREPQQLHWGAFPLPEVSSKTSLAMMATSNTDNRLDLWLETSFSPCTYP